MPDGKLFYNRGLNTFGIRVCVTIVIGHSKVKVSQVPPLSTRLIAMAEDRGRTVLWGSAAVARSLERGDLQTRKIRTERETRGHAGTNSDDEKGT